MNCIALDFGTCFSYMAEVKSAHLEALSLMPVSAINTHGVPSEVYLNEDGIYEIFNAMEKGWRNPDRYRKYIKTFLQEEKVLINGEEKDPYELVTQLIQYCVRLANDQLVAKRYACEHRIVLTHPAKYGHLQIERLKAAAEAATLENGKNVEVIGMLPEPAAVAIDYLFLLKKEQFTVLVLDIGGGTTDVAIVKAQSGGEPYKLLEYNGDPHLGGNDWDKDVNNYLVEELAKKGISIPPDKRTTHLSLLLEACKAKELLSEPERTEVLVELEVGEDMATVPLTRETFERLTRARCANAMSLVSEMLDLADAEGIDIHHVILSGGSSQMPQITQALTQLLNGRCSVELHRPATAIAFGAARYGFNKPESNCSSEIMERYLPYHLGLQLSTILKGEFRCMLQAKSRLPCSKTITVCTDDVPTDHVDLRFFRTLSKEPQAIDMAAGTYKELLRLSVRFPQMVPPRTLIDVTLTITSDNRIQVSCQKDRIVLRSSEFEYRIID